MWKYVSRRIRDTFERSCNHFDRRSTTVVNSSVNVSEDKSQRIAPPCCWFSSRKCWNTSQGDNNTNSKRWNFEHLNRSWIGAITWSSALVLGWYTSQLIHLKLKYKHKETKTQCATVNLFSALHPYVTFVNDNGAYSASISQFGKIIETFAPTVHLISNDQSEGNKEGKSNSASDVSSAPDTCVNELSEVLNSIENKLGLAAIENGHHKDGLNLLRSAANRNHAPAQYNLGLCYEMGLGVPVNEKIAMELYRSAAAREHPGALYNLGIYYGQGRGGLARDLATATRLLRLAAVQGQRDAIDALDALDADAAEPPRTFDEPPSSYRFSLYPDTIVPTHTTLFIENVNFMPVQNSNAKVY